MSFCSGPGRFHLRPGRILEARGSLAGLPEPQALLPARDGEFRNGQDAYEVRGSEQGRGDAAGQ